MLCFAVLTGSGSRRTFRRSRGPRRSPRGAGTDRNVTVEGGVGTTYRRSIAGAPAAIVTTEGRPANGPERRVGGSSGTRGHADGGRPHRYARAPRVGTEAQGATPPDNCHATDRKSTRLNSSHANISYAVFCL